MAQKTLTTSYLSKLANANHDGVTQQIDDRLQAFETENTMLIQAAAGVHTARQAEDTAYRRFSGKDFASDDLKAADRLEDQYMSTIKNVLGGLLYLPYKMILELKRYIQTVFIFYIAFIWGFNLCHAQKKQGKPLTPFFRKAGESKIVDRSVITAYYAFNAIKNDDISTYIDYQKLQIGKNIIKYCSEWIYQAEVKQDKFRQAHPHTNNVPHFLDFNKGEYWNEYQYSDYFIQLGKITVYTSMPFAADQYNCYYQEPYPLMKWSLCNEKCEILGYECQKATCLFRGRNYIAWFAPLIPVQHGPWKFGGLPGLILKVSDTQNIYTFECVRLTKQPQDITRRPFNGYEETKRTLVLKLARKFNENYDQATGATTRDNQGRVVMSQKQKYEPLELE